jgi:hypothetical protein
MRRSEQSPARWRTTIARAQHWTIEKSGLRQSELRAAGIAALALLGFVIGIAVAGVFADATDSSAEFARTPKFRVWILLIGLQTAYWGAIAPTMWRWRRNLLQIYNQTIGTQRGLFRILVLFSLCILLLIGLLGRSGSLHPLHLQWVRLTLLMGIGLTVTWPGILGIRAVQTAAESYPWTDTETDLAEVVQRYSELTDYLRGFLNALGVMVALIVFSAGAFIAAMQAFLKDREIPSEVNLLYGAFFAAAVGLIFFPAHSAVRGAAARVLEHWCSIPNPDHPEFIDRLERRNRLGTLLQLGESTRENFEKGLVIASPLLAGLISTFIHVD